MATPDDVAERYQSLARKVPALVLASMGPAELRHRVEFASDLYDDAARASNEYEVRRLHKEASRVLEAISLRSFISAAQLLTREIERAKESGGGKAERDLLNAFNQLYVNHPQPGMTLPDVLAEISNTNVAAERPRRWYQFWRNN